MKQNLPVPKQWTDIEIGYLAGIIDGEGSIGIRPGNIDIDVTSTDHDICDRIQRYSGVGVINGPYLDKREGNKKVYVWTLARREQLYALLQAIYPHMSLRRQDKINEALELLNQSLNRIVICKGCSTEFTTAKGHQKYCNEVCRGSDSARRQRARKKALRDDT